MNQDMLDSSYAVILAGGSGTRFWPKSRQDLPKQQLALTSSDQTMLELTLQRLDGLIPPERRLIVTHQRQAESTKRLVGDLCPHILAEPEARNTAPALAMAALEIEHMHGQHRRKEPPIMVSLHADHDIQTKEMFQDTLKDAITLAHARQNLTLVGIEPQHPETGYGYIECGDSLQAETGVERSFTVASFKEKPERQTAEAYLKLGTYLWNSGMFIWRCHTLLEELERYLPEVLGPLQELQSAQPDNSTETRSFSQMSQSHLAATYSKLPAIAIDDGLLEKSQRTALLRTSVRWNDIGSWSAMEKVQAPDTEGNVIQGECIAIDTRDCTIHCSDGPLIATIGVSDLVVVATKDAVMVCPKDRAQEVKQVVEQLKAQGREELT